MAEGWYSQVNGQVRGQLTYQQLKQLADAGVVQRETLVRIGASGKWVQAWNVKGVIAPPQPTTQTAADEDSVFAFIQSIGAAPDTPGVSARDRRQATSKPCPFCGEEILVVAKKCKHCGGFLSQEISSEAVQFQRKNSQQYVLTELTAKKYKLVQLISILSLLLFTALIIVCASSQLYPLMAISAALWTLSFFAYVVCRILVWWEHG